MVIGGWRILHNEELHKLYTLTNIIGIINSRRMDRSRRAHGEPADFVIDRIERNN
jgi:hypothetical protein